MSAMKQWSTAVGGPIGVAIAVIGIAGVLIYFSKQAKQAIVDAGTAIANVNKDTAYEGAGVVGTLGNVTNQVSGGFFERLGSKIGGGIYDLTHPAPPEPPTYQPRSITVKEQARWYEQLLGK